MTNFSSRDVGDSTAITFANVLRKSHTVAEFNSALEEFLARAGVDTLDEYIARLPEDDRRLIQVVHDWHLYRVERMENG